MEIARSSPHHMLFFERLSNDLDLENEFLYKIEVIFLIVYISYF